MSETKIEAGSKIHVLIIDTIKPYMDQIGYKDAQLLYFWKLLVNCTVGQLVDQCKNVQPEVFIKYLTGRVKKLEIDIPTEIEDYLIKLVKLLQEIFCDK